MDYSLLVYYIFTFVAGTLFGSFVNVVSDRSVSGESIFFGRSHCDHCKKPLKVQHLFPILSFAVQGGKCSYCKGKLSWYYPISELISGVIFVVSAVYSHVFTQLRFETMMLFVYFAVILSFYLILFLTDVKYRLLPDKIVFTAIWFTVLFFIVYTSVGFYLTYKTLMADEFGKYLVNAGYLTDQLVSTLKYFGYTFLGAFGISLFFMILIFITKGRGMGAGDVKLGFLIGLVNGFPLGFLAIFLGFVFGALFSLVLIIFKKKTIKDTIAFGPFLVVGSVVAFFFGNQILGWYTKFL